MLPTYQHYTQATVTVDYPSVDGAYITPSEVKFRVADEVGNIVLEETSLTVEDGASQLTININPEFNVVPTGQVRGIRAVILTFTAPTGTHSITSRYVVEKPELLVVTGNSFQTYDQALLTRFDLPAFDGWDNAEERDQIAALVTAHDRMCRLRYRYKVSQNSIAYDARDPYWTVGDIRSIRPDEFERWPTAFKTALRRAQMLEADQVLKGDPVADKRNMGIISESIGEAKMFFNARPPLRQALSTPAMQSLSGYLHSDRRIGRA